MDKHELIAAGQAVAIGPPLDYATGLHPGLTTIPLRDIEPSQVVLATRTSDRSRLVSAFRKHAEAQLRTRQSHATPTSAGIHPYPVVIVVLDVRAHRSGWCDRRAWCRRHGRTAPAVPAWAKRLAAPDSQTPARSTTAIDRLIARRDVGVREKTLYRLRYETAARAEEILTLNIEDLDLTARRARVKAKGRAHRAERSRHGVGPARVPSFGADPPGRGGCEPADADRQIPA